MNINSQKTSSKRPSVESQMSQKNSTQFSFLGDKRYSANNEGVHPSQKSEMSSATSLKGQGDNQNPLSKSSQLQIGQHGAGSNSKKQMIVVQNNAQKNNVLNNKKYSLDDRSENYIMQLQEFTHEGALEFQQRKFSQATDVAATEKSITPAYSHNQPFNNRFSPFYFHQDNSQSIDHQVKPHRIEIVEETPHSARQNSNKNGSQQLVIPMSHFRQHNNSQIPLPQQPGQMYPSPQMFNPFAVPHFGDNPLVNNSSFHSQVSNASFAQIHQNSMNIQHMQNSFSLPSYNNSLVLPGHQKTNSQHYQAQSSCILNQADNNSCHSSFGISQMSQQLPCQCTACLQAQMAYLQQLLIQQQQLYLQQAMNNDQANESMHSQNSNKNNTSLYNHPKPQNLEKHKSIRSGSNSIPSNDESSIPDEIYSMQSQDQDDEIHDLDREQKILRDQQELQSHYEKFMQQELLEQEEILQRQNTGYPYELNINPNPQENILKKNYIELPLGEIPEMKESFYEDQSRYTNSSMSKKFGHSQFGAGGMTTDYNQLQRSSCKKSSRMDSIRTITRLSMSGEKENLDIYDTIPIDPFISRNPQSSLHLRNFSHQNPAQNASQQLEPQLFNQYGTVVTPNKQRQLSGSNWGTSINKDVSGGIPYQVQTNLASGQHHRHNSSFIQNQQLLQVFNQQQMQTSNNPLNMTDLFPFNKSQISNDNQLLSSSKDDMISQVNDQFQMDEQQEVQQFVQEFQNNQKTMMMVQQPSAQTQSQLHVYKTTETQQSRQSDMQPEIQEFEEELDQQFKSFQNNPSFQQVVIYETSFDRQEDIGKRRELSSSMKNQSYEKDKTDKLIQYILENEPYQHSGRNSKRGEGQQQQRQAISLSQRNLESSLKKCDGPFKTVDSDLRIGNFDEYFYPVSVVPFMLYNQSSAEENENQKENMNPVSEKSSRDTIKSSKTDQPFKQQKCSNINEQQQYYHQNSNMFDMQKEEPEVYRVQTLLKKPNADKGSATKPRIDYVYKDNRSKSVEPKNGRIFQKYNAFKTVSNALTKPIREQKQFTNSRGQSNGAANNAIKTQRWSSQPSNNRKSLNSENKRLSLQQNVLKPINIQNNVKNTSRPRQQHQQQTQLIKSMIKPTNSDAQSKLQIQQAVSYRLSAQSQRGKNIKQQSRQPRQMTNRQSMATPIAARKQESIFTKLANQNLTGKKSKIEKSSKKQTAITIPQALSTPTNNYYLRAQTQSKKFQKTLFEMSELPSNENIQRSISVKRQQNQLIVSLPKRKSSVQSNESAQNDLFNLIKSREKANRRSIENVSVQRNIDSLKKERIAAQVIQTDEKIIFKKKPIKYLQMTRQSQSSTKKHQFKDLLSSRSRSSKPYTSRNSQLQEQKLNDPKTLLNSIKNTALSFKLIAEKQKSRPLFSSRSPPQKKAVQQAQSQLPVSIKNQKVMQHKISNYVLETPDIRKQKLSNPSEIQITEESVNQPIQSQPATERNSMYKNPFHNSNMASYRESFFIPGQQHSKKVSSSFARDSPDQKLQYASVYQKIISSQVEEEDCINESLQEIDEDSDKNEIEFILSENHKSLNLNEINDIQQTSELQNKINQYYKLKEVSDKQHSIQLEQDRFQYQQHVIQHQIPAILHNSVDNETIGNRELQQILNQLEQSNRSRATTVQNFTSFNTLDQQEFMSFNSQTNVQQPKSAMDTVEKRKKGIVQEPIIQQLPQPAQTLPMNQPTLHKGLDSGTNLIETPISKEISASNSERGTSKQYSSDPKRNSSFSRGDVYQSPSIKKKSNAFNNEKQNFCLPNALFFNSTAQSKNQRNSVNRRSVNNRKPITQYNQIFKQTSSKNGRQSSDIDVLRESTDNSPQLTNNDYTNPYASSMQNSKNESSIIIRSFGIDQVTAGEDTSKSFHKRANIPKYKKNDLNYMSTRDKTNQSHKSSSNSQLSSYKADDEQDCQRTTDQAKYRNLKLSQDEKNFLRERCEQHRQSSSSKTQKYK
ncbi:UNKNOWN [Stylonychia lemnae]|uniref:Uncharacterized protein n=1 Tax=Stylonychia lemnae TaxID=5949 RepID=A0A078ATV5_STYLE|nr:UNKNOWN [Stylonychia lemnae]|eukprot:CDW84667.1 UNKNOWN [Stylonychia lemnae]